MDGPPGARQAACALDPQIETAHLAAREASCRRGAVVADAAIGQAGKGRGAGVWVDGVPAGGVVA